ncbi:MAG: polysaccharide deacetylase family protein [Candidatus Omnitrophica bacterium]|nr:polysaccharide deacetylase family protein [Candidatus Omnitrophota bacterium]
MTVTAGRACATTGYLALCYHYLRPPKAQDRFPRLLGLSLDQLSDHLALFQRRYELLSPEEAWAIAYGSRGVEPHRYGVLLTFDDGLAEHVDAARMLSARGIRAFFFIPTCILRDRLPANPIIVHYGIAAYGLERFLQHYRAALEEEGLSPGDYDIPFRRGRDDPWMAIAAFKRTLTYRLPPHQTRRVLLHIYRRSLLHDHPDILTQMHLDRRQVEDILQLGHAIGVHSHSHVSIAGANLDEAEFLEEVVEPKRYLERTLEVPVNALSYPFGDPQDCLTWETLLRRTREYELAFTVQEVVNTKTSSPLELGRFAPTSSDTAETIHAKLTQMIQEHERR